jgi:hypothetical protein
MPPKQRRKAEQKAATTSTAAVTTTTTTSDASTETKAAKENDMYALVSTSDRGRIILAISSIPTGSTIHTESPLAVWPANDMTTRLSKRTIAIASSWCSQYLIEDPSLLLYPLYCLSLPIERQRALFELHAPEKPPSVLKKFFDALYNNKGNKAATAKTLGLSSVDEVDRLHQMAMIINANAFAIGNGRPPPIAMYSFVPLLNHSCAPSCWRIAMVPHDSLLSVYCFIECFLFFRLL